MNKREIELLKSSFETSDALVEKTKQRVQVAKKKQQVGFGFALVMVLVVGLAIIQSMLPKGDEVQGIVGLPIEDSFIVSDAWQKDGSVSLMLDYQIEGLDDWFKHDIDAIVIAKVVDIRESRLSDELINVITDVSIEVLETVVGSVEGTLTVREIGFSAYTEMSQHSWYATREGGVYVLPLANEEEGWRIEYDLFVLFEIDENGNIDSHSNYEQFRKYNGAPYTTLINDIKAFMHE